MVYNVTPMSAIHHILQGIKTGFFWARFKGSDKGRYSYSQTGEDLIIRTLYNWKGVKNPSYLDIGAHHPFIISNTAFFYLSGSRGINIDPDPTLIKAFQKDRPLDINLNCGIGPKAGVFTLYIINERSLNTFSKEDADDAVKQGRIIEQTIEVPILTIEDVLEKYCKGVFPSFFSLDVEGLDLEILQSIPWSRTSPDVICVEAITYDRNGTGGKKRPEMIEYVLSKGYFLFADTYLNSILVKESFWHGKQGN